MVLDTNLATGRVADALATGGRVRIAVTGNIRRGAGTLAGRVTDTLTTRGRARIVVAGFFRTDARVRTGGVAGAVALLAIPIVRAKPFGIKRGAGLLLAFPLMTHVARRACTMGVL